MLPQHIPSHQAWRPMSRPGNDYRERVPRGWGQISTRFCSVGAQNWNKGVPRTCEGASRDLPSGVMEWSWLGLRIHAQNLPGGRQEWPKCILQEGFCSNSYTVVDTKLHMALPSFDPKGFDMGPQGPTLTQLSYLLEVSSSFRWQGSHETMAKSAPLNADSAESCQWGLRWGRSGFSWLTVW